MPIKAFACARADRQPVRSSGRRKRLAASRLRLSGRDDYHGISSRGRFLAFLTKPNVLSASRLVDLRAALAKCAVKVGKMQETNTVLTRGNAARSGRSRCASAMGGCGLRDRDSSPRCLQAFDSTPHFSIEPTASNVLHTRPQAPYGALNPRHPQGPLNRSQGQRCNEDEKLLLFAALQKWTSAALAFCGEIK